MIFSVFVDGDGDKPEKELEFKYLTSKKLCMQRVFIKKNTPGLDSAHTGGRLVTILHALQ